LEQKYYTLELTEQELFTIFCLIEDERDNILENIRENPELVREDYIQDSLENAKDLSDYIISVLDEEDEDEDDYEDEDESYEVEDSAENLTDFDFTDEFSEVADEDEQEYNDEDYLVTRYAGAGLQKEVPTELDKILKQLKDSGLKFEVINLSDLQKNSEETYPLSAASTAELKQKLLDNLSPEEVKLVESISSNIQNMVNQFKPR
jgi:hypothetical protein